MNNSLLNQPRQPPFLGEKKHIEELLSIDVGQGTGLWSCKKETLEPVNQHETALTGQRKRGNGGNAKAEAATFERKNNVKKTILPK